jgi:two-component system, cell cycle sensor histidine kinase and response regulator CckA
MKNSDGDNQLLQPVNGKHDNLAEREALIRKISSAVHSSLDSDKVLHTIVNELGTALSVCRCRLALFSEEPLPETIPITHEFIAECCANRYPLPQVINTKNNPAMEAVLASESPLAIYDTTGDIRLGHLVDKYLASQIRSLMSHTIRLDGKPIGIFSVHKCENHQWLKWEIEVVQAVTEQAAVAIRQAQLYREATEAVTRANLVNHIVASIRGSLNLDEILQTASEELSQALNSNRAYFCTFSTDEVNIIAQTVSDPSLSLSKMYLEPNNFIVQYLNETRHTLIIDNLANFVAENPDKAARVNFWQNNQLTKSSVTCPVFVDEQLWGAVVISQTDGYRKWSRNEIELVEVVKAQIEVAIKHCQLFEEAQQATKVEALIRQITQSINQTSRLQEIYETVAIELGKYLAIDSLVITRLDEEMECWNIQCAYSNGQTFTPLQQSYRLTDVEYLTSQLKDGFVISNDVEKDEFVKPYLDTLMRPGGINAFISVNLQYEDTPRITITAFSKSGPRHWNEQEKSILRAAANQMLIAVDRAELFEQVSQGKDQWESTFDALTDGLLIFDKDGLLIRANEAAAALEGVSIGEMIGRKCCSLMQGIEEDNCQVSLVLRTGRPITFEVTPERLARPVLVTISPIGKKFSTLQQVNGQASENSRSAEGEVRGAVCIVRDLSELRAAEATARAQRGFLVKLIEHANDAIFALSPDGKLIWCNDQFVKLSGITRKELSDLGYQRLIPSHGRELVERHFYQALSGESQNLELRTLDQTGEDMLLLITFTPIFDEGQVTSLLLIARDITEEKLASDRAQQAEKMRALGQITAGVAHNFNNILAAILGHAQLLKRNVTEERLASQASIIERAALDGAEMVKRIQSFGNQQMDAGYEPIDINQLVQDSISLTKVRWQGEALARGLAYQVDTDLQSLPIVRGSSSEIKEVFVNIILNSLDAMPAGGTLRIATAADEDSAIIQFTDSGVGMSEEVRKRIFEPFFTTKGPLGTGLGLAVSYSAIERHGGRLEVSSALGQGSTFTIFLPLTEGKEMLILQPQQPQKIPLESINILVIDDDSKVRAALVEMLRVLGYHAEEAASGRQGIERIEQEQFELVLTDLSMPEMDGWAVAAEVRRRWPSTKIVLITGYGSRDSLFDENRSLLNDMISKPVRIEELSLKINQVIRQK